MSFLNRVKKLIEEAPVASSGVNVNFGPLKVEPIVVTFHGRGAGNKPDKVSLADWMEANEIGEGDELTFADNESLQMHFDIDITELNPSLEFHYERDIPLLVSSPKNKTDWSETVLPSLVKIFGRDWEKKLLSDGDKEPPVVYVAAENVDSLKTPKEGQKNRGVPKFIEAFKTLEECKAARDVRYPPRDKEEEMAFPPDDDEDDSSEEGFPEEVLEQVRELYKSNKKNAKQTKKVIAAAFEDEHYDADELFAAALPNVK